MTECYGSWLCEEAERAENAKAERDLVLEKVDSELYDLLNNNGFGDFYDALTETQAFTTALTAEAQARYPNLFRSQANVF